VPVVFPGYNLSVDGRSYDLAHALLTMESTLRLQVIVNMLVGTLMDGRVPNLLDGLWV
jgi:hypothetical protein